MNTQNYASFKASKKLFDAGIVLETSFSYFQEKPSTNPNMHSFNIPQTEMPYVLLGTSQRDLSGYKDRYYSIIPAPSMAEVWRELPWVTDNYGLISMNKADNVTYCGYRKGLAIREPKFESNNPTDALIDLLIWVRKEKP